MVRRGKSEQETNLCQASGTLKGKSITVSLVPPLTESRLNQQQRFGGMFRRSWRAVPKDIQQPTICSGSMCPATFRADGYGFDVTFDVGVVRRKVSGRTTSILDITFIALGEHADNEQFKIMVKPPDLSLISRPGLLRLALKAAAIVGVAYPPGWTTDLQGKYLTTLKNGDSLPTGKHLVYGLTGDETRSKETGKILVALMPSPEVVMKSAGGKIDEQSMRDVIGLVRGGRHKEGGSMTDPEVLKLVAKFYVDYETDRPQGIGQPEYVRQKLEQGGICKSESWVRQVAVAARKAKILKQGKRNKPTAKEKK